ncbi:MAG: Swt1 family HEPN domain-containing protein [Anaerolineales bacterium]|nr:Swt1 family HEPN domain-containing protein [Anaerolineales bacterium]MDW8447601.1 Swt1 family HEPN domain-containing protein [Anaerolineales bacterium]
MSQNYVALYEALKVFRDAMLAFVKERLEKAYGDVWWERGVRRVFRDEDIAELEAQFERRFTSLLGPTRPGTERHEILDINYFTNIFEGNWKQAFAEPFGNDRTVLAWLKEVVALRNLVAHPETGDLLDDDTWRGLDTMERLLRVVNKKASGEVRQVKNRLRTSWVKAGYQPLGLELREVGISYDQGLAKLNQVIIEQEGNESEKYLDFQGHRRRLREVFDEERRGIRDPQTSSQKERTLRELDALSIRYLGMPFTDACIIEAPTIQITAEEAARKIQTLEHDIRALEKRFVAKQIKRLAQQRMGETILFLERKIERIQSELDHKRDELAQLKDMVTPPVYFSVKRILKSSGAHYFVEEQFIAVSIEITNLGKQATTVNYKEGFADTFALVEGTLEFRGQIASGETKVLSYTCYPTCPGTHLLFTEHINYTEKMSGWDRLEDTIIQVRSGTSPQLVATRFYRYVQEGIEVLVLLENKGDKIAHNVDFKEVLIIGQQSDSCPLTFNGDIPGGQSRVIEYKVIGFELQEIHFPEKTTITYSDSQGQQHACYLAAECRRVEYPFPSQPAIEGRRTEIQCISDMVEQVWRLGRGDYSPDMKRLLFIEGIEGTGKTRLVYELLRLAERRGFKSLIEDAKDRAPVKRMLRRLLGLRPDENDDVAIWKRLEEEIPGEQHALRRRQIFALISTAQVVFDQSTLEQLKADVLVLIKTLCQRRPTLLVFENVQWVPEGAEQELLLAILHSVLVNKELPLLISATYRPTEEGAPPVVSLLKMSNDHYEKLQLGPLDEYSVKALVDQLIDFPKFSRELHRFVYNWSHGNPFYLIELLRLLTDPTSSYLMRIGGEWHSAYGIELAKTVPNRVEKVILERAKAQEELGGELALLRILSAIGFELPISLVEKLVSREWPHWSSHDLLKRLHGLKRAGFLVEASDFEGYQFEHQLKREVLYQDEDFPKGERVRLRGEIARILLEQRIFSDPDEQIRQLARHLIRAPKDLQVSNINVIIKAANMERNLNNFSRSLEYYSAAIELTSRDTFETVNLLIERSRLHQMRGHWISAQRDLEQAYKLVAPESYLDKKDETRAKSARIRIQKEQGRIFLRQNRLNDCPFA